MWAWACRSAEASVGIVSGKLSGPLSGEPPGRSPGQRWHRTNLCAGPDSPATISNPPWGFQGWQPARVGPTLGPLRHPDPVRRHVRADAAVPGFHGPAWAKGTLVGKVGSVLTSSATQHGGQESTLLSFHVTLLHHGMVVAGLPCAVQGQTRLDEFLAAPPTAPAPLPGSGRAAAERKPARRGPLPGAADRRSRCEARPP